MISVSTPAGCRVLTRMLYSPSSLANVWPSPVIPNFDATYAPTNTEPLSPDTELVKMMEPPRPPAMTAGTVALMVFQVPVRFTSMTAAPLLGGDLPQPPGVHHPGVGHHDVQAPEVGDPVGHQRFEGCQVADVGRSGQDAAVFGFDRGGCGVELGDGGRLVEGGVPRGRRCRRR